MKRIESYSFVCAALRNVLHYYSSQYFSKLLVFRHASHPIFDKFNATTKGLAFSNAGTYDPYNFGKKLQRYYNCDIYLTDANFDELVVDLEVVLILQPLIRRRGGNSCDQPLITRQTVRIEFEGYKSTVCIKS